MPARARPSRPRATTIRVLIALALGLLTTMFVATAVPAAYIRWVSYGQADKSPDTFWTDGVRGGHYTRQTHPLFEWIDFRRILFTGGAEAQSFFNQNPPPRWAAVISLDQREGFEQVWTGAFGWPWRAARCEQWVSWRQEPAPPPPVLRGAIDLWPHRRARNVIPYWPVWSGLFADTAVYAAGWFIPFWIARAGRRRAGRCVFCDYDLRFTAPEAPCPECGGTACVP